MPAQPAWFHRLDAILSELRALSSPYLDRHAIEKLFGVRQRRARQLMARLPALQIGNAAAVDRLALIRSLEETTRSSDFRSERLRASRVASALETLRLHASARQISLPVSPSSPSLPPGMSLQPGHLQIHFTTAEDLASKLFALSQIMASDWGAFQQAVESRGERLMMTSP
jgi:hypothetical protein